jgi:hypothetical protein
MASFDPYTKQILLEVVAGMNMDPGSINAVTGSVGAPQNTGSKSKKRNKKFGKGPATYGTGAPQVKGEVAPLKATPEQIWFGTHDIMPAGAHLKDQAMWGFHKKFVNQYLDGITAGTVLQLGGDIANAVATAVTTPLGLQTVYQKYGAPLVNFVTKNKITNATAPFIEFAAKQSVRTALAKEYLSGQPTDFKGYGPEGAVAEWMYNAVKFVTPGKLPPKSKNGRFGEIGDLVAEKLPEVAAMGIDPLDWSTQMFGADEALAAYQGAASAPGRAAMGAMGYLSKGLQKGVYR